MAEQQPTLVHAAPLPLPTHKRFKNLTGQTFHRLKVICFVGITNSRSLWKCKCDCGNEVIADSYLMRCGNTKSCGCLHLERAKTLHTLSDCKGSLTHGLSQTRLHGIWRAMKGRCYTPKNSSYPNYGAKGISVCAEWRDSFEAFHKWAMSNGYLESLTIDRKDSRGNYEPSNCRWVTQQVNSALAHWSHGRYASTAIPDSVETDFDKTLTTSRSGKRRPPIKT